MPSTIWKYILPSYVELTLPKGATVLSVHAQDNQVCMWAMVDPSATTETRKFMYFGTGHGIPDIPMQFVGTAHINDGLLVFHVFEIMKN